VAVFAAGSRTWVSPVKDWPPLAVPWFWLLPGSRGQQGGVRDQGGRRRRAAARQPPAAAGGAGSPPPPPAPPPAAGASWTPWPRTGASSCRTFSGRIVGAGGAGVAAAAGRGPLDGPVPVACRARLTQSPWLHSWL